MTRCIFFPGLLDSIDVHVCQPPPCFGWKYLSWAVERYFLLICLPTNGLRQIMFLFPSDHKSAERWPLTMQLFNCQNHLVSPFLPSSSVLSCPCFFLSSTQSLSFTEKGTFLTAFPWETPSYQHLRLNFQWKALLYWYVKDRDIKIIAIIKKTVKSRAKILMWFSVVLL